MVWRPVDSNDGTGHHSSQWHHLQRGLVGLCDPEWLQFMPYKWEFKIPIYNILQVLSKEHRWSKTARHSKALITGRALPYPSISKTGELQGSESGDKLHIRMVLGMKHKKGDPRDSLSQRGHQRSPQWPAKDEHCHVPSRQQPAHPALQSLLCLCLESSAPGA